MDLLLKQVLSTKEVQRQSSRRSGIRIYQYIQTGRNFSSYRALPHENIFLAPFNKNNNTQILFRHLVKMGYQNAKSEYRLHNLIIKKTAIKAYFKRTLFQSIFGGFTLSTEGIEIRKSLKIEMNHLENQLPDLIQKDPQKAIEILRKIKGNIFLLSNFEFDLFKLIDKELIAEMNKKYNTDYEIGFFNYSWDNYDDHSNHFDNSCSGDSSDSTSGCSGCSGCGGGD